MEAQNISKEVKEMLAGMTGFEPEEIEDDMDLIKDLGVDSLKVIEIATAIERKFSVTVKDDQLRKLRKVSEAIQLLKDLLDKKAKKGKK